MKVKVPETGMIEYTKIERKSYKDYGEQLVVKIGAEELSSREFLMQGYEFVEIELSEMRDFNLFLGDTLFQLEMTNDWFDGFMTAQIQNFKPKEGAG